MDYNNHSKEDLIKIIEELKNNKKIGLSFEKKEEIVIYNLLNRLPVLKRENNKDVIVSYNNNNILIEGDNINALICLLFNYRRKIDFIYIDPPYNTGNNDFKYNDRFIDENNKWRHSCWLSFMEPRLKLARELLNDDGLIFISIDNNEFHKLGLIMDRIYGENNFIEEFIWIKNTKGGGNKAKLTCNQHEYIICYAKNKSVLTKEYFYEKKKHSNKMLKFVESCMKKNISVRETQELLQKYIKSLDITGGLSQYKYVDDKYEIYTLDNLNNPKNKSNDDKYNYIIKDTETNKVSKTPPNGWLYKKEKMEELIKNKIVETNLSTFRLKRFLRDVKYQNVSSIIFNNDNGIRDLENSLGLRSFEYPKPVSLIKNLISFHPNKNAIVLDFFAGSGTTGQAVLELNKEDGGNRKFILSTNNENNICSEICYPRLKKVIEGYTKTNGKIIEGCNNNLRYFSFDFISNDELEEQIAKNLKDNLEGFVCFDSGIYEKIVDEKRYKVFNEGGKIVILIFSSRQKYLNEIKNAIKKLTGDILIYYYRSYGNNIDLELFNIFPDADVKLIPSKIVECYKEIQDLIK